MYKIKFLIIFINYLDYPAITICTKNRFEEFERKTFIDENDIGIDDNVIYNIGSRHTDANYFRLVYSKRVKFIFENFILEKPHNYVLTESD